MIIVNNLCDFHDLYTSLTVTFVMYFNGRNKDILFLFIFCLHFWFTNMAATNGWGTIALTVVGGGPGHFGQSYTKYYPTVVKIFVT